MNFVLILSIFGAVILLGLFVYYVYNPSDCKVVTTISTPDGLVEIIDPKCKEGLPHTTDKNTIRMTKSIWDSHRRDEVLVHERIHLSQKQDPEIWAEFYRRYWDYEIFAQPPTSIPQKYIDNLRPNPDTDNAPWAVWRKRYLFFPNYENPALPTLKNPEILVWDIQEKRVVSVPAEWSALFCVDGICPNQYEHPHELSAEFLTKHNQSVAGKQLAEWWL
jgi:hypothetical protein